MWDTIQSTLGPFVWGGVMALVLDIPLRALERHLGWLAPRWRRAAALTVLTAGTAAALALGVWLLLPQLAAALENLTRALPALQAGLDALPGEVGEGVRTAVRTAGADLVQPALGLCAGALKGAAVNLVQAVLGLVLALYLLAGREIHLARLRRLTQAVLGRRRAARVFVLVRRSARIFAGFIAGQCAEACILAGLFLLVLLVFGLPYPLPIAAVVGVTALVPVFGAWAGGGVGLVLVLSAAPEKALLFLALFLAVQQLENHLIYPRVVGSRIGLPPLWVLTAVLLGGGLLGPAGLLLGIPAMSVLYHIGRRWVHFRLDKPDAL